MYSILLTQIVNLVYANDLENEGEEKKVYQVYPVIYNLAKDCIGQEDQNLATCTSKAWLVEERLELKTKIVVSNKMTNIQECYRFCSSKPSCVGILRSRTEPKTCWIYDMNNQTEKMKKDDDTYRAYFLKCCQLKEKDTSSLDQPIVSSYPIIFDRDFCEPQSLDNNPATCQHKVWQQIENRLMKVSPYKKYKLKYTADCMRDCLNDTKNKCKAIGSVDINEFDHHCLLYNSAADGNKGEKKTKKISNIFKIACCQLKNGVLNKNENLLMLYEPSRVCQTVSSTNVKSCPRKIWHVEDGLRMISEENKEKKMKNISSCLNECLTDAQCIAVSFDMIHLKCWFFKANGYVRIQRLHKWISYTLKCCSELLGKMANEDEKRLTIISDSREFPSYPVISNINEDCLPQEKQSIETCLSKAWLVVDNLRMERNSQKVETNILSCFQHCKKTPQCNGITMKKSKEEQCWIHRETFVNETDHEYKSFFLTCCKLKKKRIYIGKPFNGMITSHFPIVFNTESNCRLTNSYAVNCKSPIWHVMEGITLTKNTSIHHHNNSLTNKNTLDVLNECAQDFNCNAIAVEEVSPFVTVYHQYKENQQFTKTNATTTTTTKTSIVYQKMCCAFPTATRWIVKNPDLIVLSQPTTNCKGISMADVDCQVKVWFMRDGVRLKGHYDVISLTSVQSCLQECFQTLSCKGVSVDFYQRRCLLFHGTGFTDYENQPQWASYMMKCCYDIRS